MSIHINPQADPVYPENNNALSVFIRPAMLTADECKVITRMRKKLPEKEGHAGGDNPYSASLRNSKVRWLPRTPEAEWVFQKIHALVTELNQLYQFNITGFREEFQLATYTGGGHFDWHKDIGKGVSSTRKLSLSLQLSEQSDYEGGDLEFYPQGALTIPKAIGTVIVFPSFLMHRVTPVTRGTRHSLVAWAHGPTFR